MLSRILTGCIVICGALSCLADAPPMLICESSTTEDLGKWDDVVLIPDEESVLLRRGAVIQRLNLVDFKFEELLENKRFNRSELVAVLNAQSGQWILLNDQDGFPYACNLGTGEVVEFTISGLALYKGDTPKIELCNHMNRYSGALVRLVDRDPSTWPRDGNRSVYFWLNLESGELVNIPIGWDLNYFSADMKTAFFDAERDEETFRREACAFSLITGEFVEVDPSKYQNPYIPYDRTDQSQTRLCLLGNGSHMAGIHHREQFLPFSSVVLQHDHVMSLDFWDNFIGFRTRRSEASSLLLNPLWLCGTQPVTLPRQVNPYVYTLSILGDSNLVFTTEQNIENISELSRSGRMFPVAYYQDAESLRSWEVLEGVEMHPPIDPKYTSESEKYPEWSRVQLYRSHGPREASPYVLVDSQHVRPDYQHLKNRIADFGVLPEKHVRKVVLVTSSGERYMTALFRDERRGVDILWPFHSGAFITGSFVWSGDGENQKREIQLQSRFLSLVQKKHSEQSLSTKCEAEDPSYSLEIKSDK